MLGFGAAVVLVAGCSPEGGVGSGGACTTSADCPAGEVCVDGRCSAAGDSGGGGGMDSGPGVDAPPSGVTGIRIVPAATTLTCADGADASVDLDIEATYDDGSTSVVPAGYWSVDSTRLGTIDNTNGVFTATGEVAGSVTVTVEALSLMATATVTVEVERTIVVEGAPADAAARFGGAPVTDPSLRVALLYPLAGAVMPQNVYPAEVRLDAPGVRVRAYLAHDGTGHWLVTREAWRALAESAPGMDVTVAVDRWDSATGMVFGGEPRAFQFADAVIRGSIYYWDLGGGRILRIRGDGTGLEAFMPNPPPRPGDGARCVACHAISQDGRRMAAELWGGADFGAIFDLTADLSVDPAPAVVPPSVQRFLTATFNPDASRLVASFANELFLMDGNTGARLPVSGTPLPASGSAHPAWSPDGTRVAYVSGTNGGWAVDFTRGDLTLVDAMAGDAFGAPRVIYPGGGLAVARPSWSPDSALVAFQHGLHSRAREDLGGGTSAPRDAQLRIVTADGVTSFALDALNGGAMNSYYPTFSPFDEGGYFWLAFFSTRDYGNSAVGTRGSGRRQLWVAAIDHAPVPGADPSHAPYWLPQQDVTHENMAAFWTQEPCRAEGRTCATSSECCSGFCRDTGSGPMCVPEDEVPCSMMGESCRTDADCCEGAGTCVGNVCSTLG
jgi:hypothetical protein